jgi:hypothetical protein
MSIIFVILGLIFIIYILNKNIFKPLIENMASNDEAIANVASLYNNTQMTVNNLTASQGITANNLTVQGSTTTKDVNAQNITAQNITTKGMSSDNLNVNNIMSATRGYFKGGDAGGGGQTHFPYTDGTNYIRGHTTHNGNLNVTGVITGQQIAIAMIDDNANLPWDRSKWLQNIADRKLLTKSMPDGTMLPFFLNHYNSNNSSNPNRDMRLIFLVKLGNQAMAYEMPQSHDNIPNPRNNSVSNDTQWRVALQA